MLAPQELGVVITLNGPVELMRLRVDRDRPSRFLASNFQLGAVFELVRGQAITATAGLSGCTLKCSSSHPIFPLHSGNIHLNIWQRHKAEDSLAPSLLL